MKKINWLFLLVIICIFTLTSCSKGNASGDFFEGADAPGLSGDASSSDGKDEEGNNQTEAGLLTAMVLDDFKNYNEFLKLCYQDGEFYSYFRESVQFNSVLNVEYLIKVKVTLNGEVVSNAKLSLVCDEKECYKAVTNSFGIGYLFCSIENSATASKTVKVTYGNIEKAVLIGDEHEIEIELTSDVTTNKSEIIDLMFVVDTTGSMGDELRFLQAEISDVIIQVNKSCPDTLIRLGLLFYRDTEDLYVTRKFDFTTNIETQIANINNQTASGGGDFPEAVDIALKEAVEEFTWSEQSTKLLFHVCDAPPHITQNNISLFGKEVKLAAEKGIVILPVVSSGINKYTEYLLRTEAIMTGGKTIFITDHSGYGGSHLPPSTQEDLTVEYLNAAMIRLIIEYHTGVETTPVSIFDNDQLEQNQTA